MNQATSKDPFTKWWTLVKYLGDAWAKWRAEFPPDDEDDDTGETVDEPYIEVWDETTKSFVKRPTNQQQPTT